jgi:hypothetical protein
MARLSPQPDGTPFISALEPVERELTLAFVFSHTGKVSSDFGPR